MPRPTDIASRATTESRRKGAYAANAKRRELGLSLRERIARHMERRAEELVNRFILAVGSDVNGESARVAVAEIIRAIREDEQPKPLAEIPYSVFLELAHTLPLRTTA